MQDAPNRLVTLRQLHAMLEASIRDLEAEHRKEELVEQAFLVARFTKATCDAFIGMAAGMAEALGLPAAKGAKAVGGAYEAATPWATAASAWATGGRVDTMKTITSSVKGGSALLPAQYEILAKSTVVKAEILNAAMHSKQEEILPAARDYLIDLHLTIAKLETMPKNVQRAGHFAEVIKRGVEYNKALGEAFDQMIDATDENDERFRAQKTTLLVQAKLIAHKITALEHEVQALQPPQSRTLP